MSTTTKYATTLSSSEITLNGSLDDLHGESTIDVSFEYGTSLSYGNVTPTQSFTSIGDFSALLASSGFDSFHTTGTFYFFRSKVTNGITTWYGINRYFINLSVNTNDPYFIDNAMDSGTLTDVKVFDDILLLDYLHGAQELADFGAVLTSGNKPGIIELPTFGAVLTGGTIT